MTPIDDSLPARITTDCPEEARHVLLHAYSRDLDELKKALNAREKANARDPKTGETPLHAAIRSCGAAAAALSSKNENSEEIHDDDSDGIVEEAEAVVKELFMSGAIWNDADSNNETPGCVALRLGRTSLYQICVQAGVRAELLFALMDGYEQLSSGSEDEGMEDSETVDVQDGDISPPNGPTTGEQTGAGTTTTNGNDNEVTSEAYLKSSLTYDEGKLVDSDLNGVMMAWETDIMERSVAALLPDDEPGKRILNIGFGMGIIDAKFAEKKPSRHHIIEAHPTVLEHISSSKSNFNQEWEKSGGDNDEYKVYAGKWQDVVPKLLEQGEQYDAIYFDTFGEDYSQLRMFFTEHVPGLMDFEGRFSFFNGLGADRKICYDVYEKVVEIHAADAGLDLSWEQVPVEMSNMQEEGKGEWEGVRRRYWTLDSEYCGR